MSTPMKSGQALLNKRAEGNKLAFRFYLGRILISNATFKVQLPLLWLKYHFS